MVGRVAGLYGVRGWVRVRSYTRPPGNVLAYSPWYLPEGQGWRSLAVIGGQAHGKGFIAHLEGVSSPEAARPLVGAPIAVERAQLPPPAAGEYYWADLAGARVVNRAGVALGRVEGLLETGANDVLVVRGAREHLIPLVCGYIVAVDLEAGRVEVDWGEDY